MRRVVITGAGAVSPNGLTTATTWESVREGRSGINPISLFDASAHTTTFAGECTGFDPEAFIEKKRVREMARFIHLAMAATDEAVADFSPSDEEKFSVGTFIGVGFCGLEVLEANHKKLLERGPRRISPYFIPATISNLAPGQVAMRFGYKGPSFTTTSACSSGAHSIGEAMNWIRRGGIDFAIAGGTESSVTDMGIGGFAAMRALSKRNDEPTKASRPFDIGRDGFVLSEGAAVVLLEERDHAIARGANILAEVVGYGATCDAFHLTQPAPGGEGAQRAMQMALKDAGINASDVGYINAHGTSTPVGDAEELKAIKSVFGTHALEGLSISSSKSTTGHLLGAAGGLEGLICAKALQDQVLPPTINLEDPDPAAEGLDLVVGEAKEKSFEYALSNSFGFGGTNVSLVLKRHS